MMVGGRVLRVRFVERRCHTQMVAYRLDLTPELTMHIRPEPEHSRVRRSDLLVSLAIAASPPH
jgi:hypothetical protein